MEGGKRMARTVHRRTFIRKWRKFRNGMTLEQLAERVGTSHATLSRVERGRQEWTERLLCGVADALGTDPVSLLVRDPTDPEGIWSLWDTLTPRQRRQAIEVLKALKRTDD
jgi:transcriptional regulator with XRE-family HTH domain